MGPLREVALLFLKLGCTAFGGPAVHIAMMRREAVVRRRWLTEQAFLDLVGAVNLIPGPNSTEMAIHLGYLRAGPRGLIVAGACFIVPPMLMVLGAAWAYVRFGTLPETGGLLYGVKPVVVALVLQALWSLGRKGLARPAQALLGAAALAAYLAGASEIAILAAGGLLGWIFLRRPAPPPDAPPASNPPPAASPPPPSGRASPTPGSAIARLSAAASVAPIAALASPSAPFQAADPARFPSAAALSSATADTAGVPLSAALPSAIAALPPAASALPSLPAGILFLKFLKIGALLYGSGYVLLPFLNSSFGGPGGLLTEAQILDAVAVGQITPGPFFTTAAFIGYLLGGVTGGLLATLGIFLPAFVFVALTNPWIPRLRASAALGRALDGVNAVSLGLMAGAAWQLGRAAVTDWATAGLGAGALLLLLRNVSSTWIIAAGGLFGIAFHLIGG